MTSDIMTPPGIADVCGICSEIRLKIKALPADYRVTGKSERIAVRTDLGEA